MDQKFLLAAIVLAVCPYWHALHANEEVEQAIRQNRMGTLVIRTSPGAKISVQQIAHEFWFGTAISRKMFSERPSSADKEKYLQVLKENFNAAVHESALKWKWTEPEFGRVTFDDADRMWQWCHDNGIQMRGHCIYWADITKNRDWISKLDNQSLRETLEARAREVVTHYQGRIAEFDVNNEMIHFRYFADRLGDDIRADMFHWCKRANPDSILYVNDYSILNGPEEELANYELLIESLLEAGAPLGGIGLQGHLSGPVDVQKVQHVLDRLARFELPIKITEFDINSNDEMLKARGLVDLYSTCFAHPAVNGILMWGFWEGAHWRPKAALWKKDWTPTPAARAYRELIFNNWWTDLEATADQNGICEVKAFYGLHKIVEGDKELIITLSNSEVKTVVDLNWLN